MMCSFRIKHSWRSEVGQCDALCRLFVHDNIYGFNIKIHVVSTIYNGVLKVLLLLYSSNCSITLFKNYS